MADIRCPMCGKPNPAEAEVCSFCQARLKPLTPSKPSTPGSEGESPDWLAGLRGGSGDSTGWQEPSGGEAEPADETPDWLARIREQQSRESAGEEEPDWLRAISGSEAETPAGEEEPAAVPGQEAETETPDWLGVLRSEEPASPTAGAPSGEQKQDEEDWMAGLAAWSSPVTEEGTTPESEPARPEEPPAVTPPEVPAESGPEDLGWLSALGLSSEAGAETPAAQPFDESPAEPAEDLSWLSTFSSGPDTGGKTPSEEPAESGASSEAEDTGWLASLGLTSDASGDTSTGLFASGEMPPEAAAAEESGPLAAETPAGPSAGESETTGPDLSDWFSGLSLSESDSGRATGSVPPVTPPESFETPFGVQSAGSSPFSGEEPPAVPGETPDWLKVFGEQTASGEPPKAEETPPPVMPFAGSDMPEWLGPGEETAQAEKSGEESGPEGLEAAQLPGWLQAMRPVEAVAPVDTGSGQDEHSVVKAGPLAGMAGIVPGEAAVSKVRRPPVYSARLRVSENQRLQASLLEEMLSEEAKPRPARAERSHVPQRIVRLLIALLLLVVTTLPLVSGTQILPLPDLFPPETVSFQARVEALPENAPVLLAVDFEPGLSEEMSLASASVLDHLAAKKARLALLSTVPTGPVLADNLLREAAARNPAFQPDSASVNLGFLPGGTAGLQEFASRPQVALQYRFDGQSAWDTPALQGVSAMREFALVIVLTENAETARAWIEQVQPRLGEVPLLFVISAQSAPFIHPYIDSGQVQGMVAGMSGGITYAQIGRQPAGAASLWDAYQFGLFAAALLVLLGGLWQFIRSLGRKPEQKGA